MFYFKSIYFSSIVHGHDGMEFSRVFDLVAKYGVERIGSIILGVDGEREGKFCRADVFEDGFIVLFLERGHFFTIEVFGYNAFFVYKYGDFVFSKGVVVFRLVY